MLKKKNPMTLRKISSNQIKNMNGLEELKVATKLQGIINIF